MYITHLFLQVLTLFYLENLSCHSALWHQVFQCYNGLQVCVLELNITFKYHKAAPILPKTDTLLPCADISCPLLRQQAINQPLVWTSMYDAK